MGHSTSSGRSSAMNAQQNSSITEKRKYTSEEDIVSEFQKISDRGSESPSDREKWNGIISNTAVGTKIETVDADGYYTETYEKIEKNKWKHKRTTRYGGSFTDELTDAEAAQGMKNTANTINTNGNRSKRARIYVG